MLACHPVSLLIRKIGGSISCAFRAPKHMKSVGIGIGVAIVVAIVVAIGFCRPTTSIAIATPIPMPTFVACCLYFRNRLRCPRALECTAS